MARFLLTTEALEGHFNPTRAIVRELVRRGHEVVWMTGATFEAKVAAAGARFVPLPPKIDLSIRGVFETFPVLKGRRGAEQGLVYQYVFLDKAAPTVEALDAVLADFPADVLVGDNVQFGAYFTAERRGLPSAMISVLPLMVPSRDTAPAGFGLPPDRRLRARLKHRWIELAGRRYVRDVERHATGVRHRLGLPPFAGPYFRAVFELPDLILQLTAPAFEYPRSDAPAALRFVGPVMLHKDPAFVPPAWWPELDAARAAGRPVVLVNQGTLSTDVDDLIVNAVEGLKEMDALVVAVSVAPGEAGPLPANVRAEPYVPFAHLLPHVDVVVTNGGYGATQLALAHGIPLVVAGDTDDKMEVAARVAWTGAGLNLRTHRPAPEAVRAAVAEVLADPAYRASARRLADAFARYDAPTQAADLLETLVPARATPAAPAPRTAR
jgi:MGT family glycosyltransferase